MGRVDHLRGFKENVIMGHLIPAGTGYAKYRNVKLQPLGEPVEPVLVPTVPDNVVKEEAKAE